MKKWIQYGLISLSFFVLFFILTFPTERLAPRISQQAEKILSQLLGPGVQCETSDFGFAFPLKIKLRDFVCQQGRDSILNFKNIYLGFGLFSQSLRLETLKGSMQISGSFLPSLSPSRISADFDHFPIESIAPLVFEILRGQIRNIVQPELQGEIDGKLDLPIKEFWKSNGSVDLQFPSLQLPSQSMLELIGLQELKFNTAELKANLSNGKLKIESAQFLSNELSGKAAGELELQEAIMDSTGDLSLKWKIVRSTALQSSLLGPQLLQAPCPSQDSDGFCTKKINRLSEIQSLFRGGF